MKKNLLKISIIVLFISLFALLNWNSFTSPFAGDEGEYAYSAWLLRTGDLPYENTFLQKPPLIIYTYLFGQLISPESIVIPRILAAIFIFLTAILVGLIALKEWGKYASIFSIFIFLPLVYFPVNTPFTANTEVFMILPMTALLALFVYFKNSKKIWPYILAGVLSSFAIFYKPISLLVVISIILFWLFEIYKNQKNFSSIIKPILLIGLSSLFSAIILLIPFFKVLPILFQEVIKFNSYYIGSIGNPIDNFIFYLKRFLGYWWFLLIIFISLFFKIPQNIKYYLILLGIAILSIFSTPIGHYYIMIMPILALIFGALYNSFLLKSNRKQKIIITIIVLPLIIYSMLYSFKEQFFLSPNELSVWVYGTSNPYIESREVANHLAMITNPDDRVFVAGSEPQIYYYSKRKSMSRFDITFPLNLPTPYREKFQNELISDFEKTPPKAIVLTKSILSGLSDNNNPTIFIDYFNILISENYNIIGGYVWDDLHNNGHWEQPLKSESFKNASFIIYIKK